MRGAAKAEALYVCFYRVQGWKKKDEVEKIGLK
jgi:hypothetical protein